MLSPPKGQRLRRCVKCNREQWIRKDNKSERCKSCAARESVKKALEVIRKNRLHYPCDGCGTLFFTNKSSVKKSKKHFCSRACRSNHLRVTRECHTCKKMFSVWKSSISSKTNASGHYCSRRCYEVFLCKPDRINGRGSQWKKIRSSTITLTPFCALCGTLKFLQVHHIVPYRITHDNTLSNLVPLCVKCHKKVEFLTQKAEASNISASILKLFFGSTLREHQFATAMLLQKIQQEIQCRN